MNHRVPIDLPIALIGKCSLGYRDGWEYLSWVIGPTLGTVAVVKSRSGTHVGQRSKYLEWLGFLFGFWFGRYEFHLDGVWVVTFAAMAMDSGLSTRLTLALSFEQRKVAGGNSVSLGLMHGASIGIGTTEPNAGTRFDADTTASIGCRFGFRFGVLLDFLP